jgi:hypothetical protein
MNFNKIKNPKPKYIQLFKWGPKYIIWCAKINKLKKKGVG